MRATSFVRDPSDSTTWIVADIYQGSRNRLNISKRIGHVLKRLTRNGRILSRSSSMGSSRLWRLLQHIRTCCSSRKPVKTGTRRVSGKKSSTDTLLAPTLAKALTWPQVSDPDTQSACVSILEPGLRSIFSRAGADHDYYTYSKRIYRIDPTCQDNKPELMWDRSRRDPLPPVVFQYPDMR
jgi:hypothetical protein